MSGGFAAASSSALYNWKPWSLASLTKVHNSLVNESMLLVSALAASPSNFLLVSP
jgi:hypothetical protein